MVSSSSSARGWVGVGAPGRMGKGDAHDRVAARSVRQSFPHAFARILCACVPACAPSRRAVRRPPSSRSRVSFLFSPPLLLAWRVSEREWVRGGRAGARTDLPNDAAAAAALIVVGVVGARPHPTSFLPHIKPRPRSRPQAACVRTCTCPPSSGSSSACRRCTAAPSERTAGRGTASSASP